MFNTKYTHRMKVKAENLYELTNNGYVVSQNDCLDGEFWLFTNSPGYLKMFVEDDKLEVVVAIEEVPQS